MIFLAILVTGDGGENKRSVEALWSNGSSLCSLPDLPDDHYVHTQSGLVTCGGYSREGGETSCYTLRLVIVSSDFCSVISRFCAMPGSLCSIQIPSR